MCRFKTHPANKQLESNRSRSQAHMALAKKRESAGKAKLCESNRTQILSFWEAKQCEPLQIASPWHLRRSLGQQGKRSKSNRTAPNRRSTGHPRRSLRLQGPRTLEPQNYRTPEPQNLRTVEHQNARTPEEPRTSEPEERGC